MVERRIDAVDAKIVEELRRDARLPVAVLARRVGLSRNAVRQRIERLERDGLIAGYTIVPGKELAKSRQVTAVMMVYRRDRMRGADVLSVIRKIPEVQSCYIVSGEADLVVQLAAASQERINQIWSQLSALAGVVDTKTAMVLSTVVNPRMG